MHTSQHTTFLRPSRNVNSDHPAVIEFAGKHARHLDSSREIAIELYYAVRDQFLYDPYRIDQSPEGLTASRYLEAGYGFCITNAALLAAAARVMKPG